VLYLRANLTEYAYDEACVIITPSAKSPRDPSSHPPWVHDSLLSRRCTHLDYPCAALASCDRPRGTCLDAQLCAAVQDTSAPLDLCRTQRTTCPVTKCPKCIHAIQQRSCETHFEAFWDHQAIVHIFARQLTAAKLKPCLLQRAAGLDVLRNRPPQNMFPKLRAAFLSTALIKPRAHTNTDRAHTNTDRYPRVSASGGYSTSKRTSALPPPSNMSYNIQQASPRQKPKTRLKHPEDFPPKNSHARALHDPLHSSGSTSPAADDNTVLPLQQYQQRKRFRVVWKGFGRCWLCLPARWGLPDGKREPSSSQAPCHPVGQRLGEVLVSNLLWHHKTTTGRSGRPTRAD